MAVIIAIYSLATNFAVPAYLANGIMVIGFILIAMTILAFLAAHHSSSCTLGLVCDVILFLYICV